jgi:Xaa-Pro aminopeptidase
VKTTGRVDRLRDRFDELKVEALIVSSPANVRYLTGFSGEGWAVIDGRATIVTDGRYTLRAERESPGVDVIRRSGSMKDAIVERLSDSGARCVGFEADHLTVNERDSLKKSLRGTKLVPLSGLLRTARMVKDARETKLLREAIAATDKAFRKIVKRLKPGLTEKEVALEIERQLLLAGADRLSFPSIIAGGPNSADPHAEPTDRKLKKRDNVKLDFGGEVQGYHADLTRTVFLRKPSKKQREIYETVLEAQLRAIDACRPGALAKDVDAVARDYIKQAGYGDAFSHGLGHGVGLAVHEGPGLGHTSEDVLAAGMLVTVEPGIYLEGWGGVRIEDVVLITNKGHEVITQAPKLLG